MSVSMIDLDWLDDALGEDGNPKQQGPDADYPDWLDDICGEPPLPPPTPVAPPDPVSAARETWGQHLRWFGEVEAVAKLQKVATAVGTGLLASTKFSRWGSRDIPSPPPREELRAALQVVLSHLRTMTPADAGMWLQDFARSIGLDASRSLYGRNEQFRPGGEPLEPGHGGGTP